MADSIEEADQQQTAGLCIADLAPKPGEICGLERASAGGAIADKGQVLFLESAKFFGTVGIGI